MAPLLAFELRHGSGRAAGRRHPMNRGPVPRRKDDHPVRTPGPTSTDGRVADRLRRTTRRLDLLELALREETEEAAVWGPEGIGGSFRVRKRARRQRVDRSHPKSGLSVRGRGDERELSAVGREGDGRPKRPGFRRENRRAHQTGSEASALPEVDRRSDSRQCREEGECCQAQCEALPAGPSRNRGRRQADRRVPLCDPFQFASDIVGGLPALVGVLGEAGLDDSIQSRRAHRLNRRDRLRIQGHDG